MAIDLTNLNGLTVEALQALVQEANGIIAGRVTDEGVIDWAELTQNLIKYLNQHTIELRIITTDDETQTSNVTQYFITDNIGVAADNPGLITLRDYVPITDGEEGIETEEPEVDDDSETEDEDSAEDESVEDEDEDFDVEDDDEGSEID